MRKLLLTFFSLILLTSTTNAAVNILKCSGWFEAGYATWEAVSGATNYNVYIAESGSTAWKQLDKELVRQYPNYFRADAVGLKAGDYQLKMVTVSATGKKSNVVVVNYTVVSEFPTTMTNGDMEAW
ncbi:MAG: hypothetical protein HUK07_09425, partial [Bacteroidaceae bacterium]|nr:hypothetical protein [Bacteroidaceae bacterium]